MSKITLSPLDAALSKLIFDAINGTNKDLNLDDNTNPIMWKDMLEAFKAFDDYDEGEKKLRGPIMKYIVDCYAISTAIINTPEEENTILGSLHTKYLIASDKFEVSFIDWYNSIEK